jgi:4-aminobutyrate aminotransferase-like enzyme
MQGLELASAEQAGRLAELARDGGLLVLAGGRRGSMVQLLPPLTITDAELARGLAVLDLALARLADP